MIKVGLTGGIGSGKSTVAHFFENIGIPVYFADPSAKRLMTENSDLKYNLIKTLGKEAYNTIGQLNTKYISSKIFNNPELLSQINTLVHPAVEKDFLDFAQQHANAPYIIKEAAILIESGSYKQVDKIILVSAPETLRIKRVCKRDGIDASLVKERINKQWSDEQKQPYIDFQIHNDDQQLLIPQILKIHQQLI
jgi:dephospho-CoA kinase